MKSEIIFRQVLFAVLLILGISCQNKSNSEKKKDLSLNYKTNINSKTDPDKTILIGEWSITGTPKEIKITGVADSGKLDVSYFDPKFINIVKANWQKTSTLLSIFIELEDINYPDSSFKLNYIPERDVLVGDFFDSAENATYSVEFVRIK